jgi:putative FmdB family regulatory protein
MPLYEYKCKKCGHQFEKIQKYSDRMVKKCPDCGGRVEQTITAPAVQFKGTGWYVTDYAKKSGGLSSSDGGKDSKKEDKSKSDSGAKQSSSKESSAKESSSKEGSSSSSSSSSSREGSSKESSSRKSDKRK